jgi:capsid protein
MSSKPDPQPWGVWEVGHHAAPRPTETRETARAWEAAHSDRLNAAHWEMASTDTMSDMRTDLPELYRRARHESINNAVLDGAIETQATNAAGSQGPALQILTHDAAWNEKAERIFSAWAAHCEHAEGLSLADLVDSWVQQHEIYGAIFAREYIGRTLRDYKIEDIGPESLDTQRSGKNIFAGVELDETGVVTAYHTADPISKGKPQRLPAEYCIHFYRRRFAMQRRGFARMASALPDAADIRDYDNQMSDAARAQADYAIYLVSKESPAELSTPTANTMPVQRRVLRYIRPGWEPKFPSATMPATQYPQYRKERHTDIANAMEMPWMIFRKDASNHNMSSARFDAARYAEAVRRFQAKFGRVVLNRIALRVIRLAQLFGLLDPTPIKPGMEEIVAVFPESAIPMAWTWPRPPAVDPAKEAMAQRVELENRTLAWSEAVSAAGRRPEETLRMLQRDNAAFIAAGLPPMIGPIPTEIPPEVIAGMMADPPDQPPSDPAAAAEPLAPGTIDPNAELDS